MRRRRYWTLPVEEPIHFKRADDYTDRFMELLRTALRDRLRTRRVGVLMSGGLDSPTIAAVALDVLRERSTGFFLQAITSVYDRLVPDVERHYAGLVAEYLNIPIRYDVRDDETSIVDWDQVTVHTPEPVDNPPAFAAAVEFLKNMAPQARVFLYGEGPDNALRYEWRPYLSHLVAGRHGVHLLRALSNDLLMHPRVPLWSSIRQLAGARGQQARWRETFPVWLNEEFAARVVAAESDGTSGNERRPRRTPSGPSGYDGFSAVQWQSAVRRLRHHRRLESCRDSAPLSRPAAAAIHAGPARDAVVPEQTDHPQVDASGVAARRAPTKENGPSGEPRFPAGPGLRIAPAGAIAGSAEIREPG